MEESHSPPLILTVRDVRSQLPPHIASPEPEGVKSPPRQPSSRDSPSDSPSRESTSGGSPSRGSPDSRCSICLGRLQDKSYTDNCMHQFCFLCLSQWSKIKAECPLCKQPFKSIIHSVTSNSEQNEKRLQPYYVLPEIIRSYNVDLISVDQRYHLRATTNREYFQELAESFMTQSPRLPAGTYQIHPLTPFQSQTAKRYHRSRRFRRNIYTHDLWVQNLSSLSGRYRECTPQFYRENPAQIHRIIPWLNREVNVLLSGCQSHAQYVISRITSLLPKCPIRSREFREHIRPYFGGRTDHFIHELHAFARSVYDMMGFDENAVYGMNPAYATEVQEISSSDDSDVRILEPVKVEGEQRASRRRARKLLWKGVLEAPSDEPMAGPSGISSTQVSRATETCESDVEEVKVLEYEKPEPEVVTLSSGEEGGVCSDVEVGNEGHVEVVSGGAVAEAGSSRESGSRGGGRSEKGKCRSNGFGLKGQQRKNYMKSRRQGSVSRSSSVSSRRSSSSSSSCDSSVSSISSVSSCSSWTSRKSRSSTRNCEGSAVGERRRGRSGSSSSRCSRRSSTRAKRKESKGRRRKYKKASHRSSKRRASVRRSRKKVRSCVIVPNGPSDASSSSVRGGSPEGHGRLRSYWSLGIEDGWVELGERKGKHRHRSSSCEERSRKRGRGGSYAAEGGAGAGREGGGGEEGESSGGVDSLPVNGVSSSSQLLPRQSSQREFVSCE